MYLPWIPGVTVRSLRNFGFGVSYFTDGVFGNSQTRLVNTRCLVFAGAHELKYNIMQISSYTSHTLSRAQN